MSFATALSEGRQKAGRSWKHERDAAGWFAIL